MQDKVMNRFLKPFTHTYRSLPSGICEIIDEGKVVAHAVVCEQRGRSTSASPLLVTFEKLSEVSKHLNPLVVWGLDDSVAYSKVKTLSGDFYLDEGHGDLILKVSPSEGNVKFVK